MNSFYYIAEYVFQEDGITYKYQLDYDQRAGYNDSPAAWDPDSNLVLFYDEISNWLNPCESIIPPEFERLIGDVKHYQLDDYCESGDLPTFLAAIKKHCERENWSYLEDVDLSGYCDYRPAFIATESGYGTADNLANELFDYYNGDIYELSFWQGEEMLADSGAFYTWKLLDSVSDCYFTGQDAEKEYVNLCKEYFNAPAPRKVA